MAKKLPKETQEIISKYGLTQADVWDCSNTWVILHRALEKVAAKEGITFDPPQILNSDIQTKHIAMLVVGHDKAGNSQWSIGEATPYNYKNSREDAKDRYGNPLVSYPYAIAEKRAKDRVIIKLLGLHGFYSEDEADEFKDDAKKDFGPAPVEGDRMSEDAGQKEKSVYQLKKEGAWEQIVKEMNDCHNEAELTAWKNEEKAKGRFADWPDTYSKSLHDEYVKRIKDFRELAKEAAE